MCPRWSSWKGGASWSIPGSTGRRLASERATSRAIIDSSSVRMTRTWGVRLGADDEAPRRVRTGSSVMPRNRVPRRYGPVPRPSFRRCRRKKRGCRARQARRPGPRPLSWRGSRRVRRPRPLEDPDLVREQVLEIGAGLRNPEQPGFVVHERVKLIGREAPGLGEKPGQPRVNIAAARRHDQSRGRRQPHRGIDALEFVDRSQAGPSPGVPGSRGRQPPPYQGGAGAFHQIGIRQAMKTIPPHAALAYRRGIATIWATPCMP